MSLTHPPNDLSPQPTSRLKAILPYTTVAMIIAALYMGWTLYSRHQENEEAQRALAAKKEARNQQVVDQVFGSGEIKITTFGADTGVLRRGQTTHLCYGVVNAKTLKIEPTLSEPVKPTWQHCAEIAPKTTTTYTLTATDGAGNTKSASLTIQVK